MKPMPLAVYVVLLPVWLALTAGVAVGVAGAGVWGGLLLVAVLGYPVALVAAAVLTRSAQQRGDAAAARRWRLLPLPWVIAFGGLLTWAMSP